MSVGTYSKNSENVDAAVSAVLAGKPQVVIMVAISRASGMFLKKLKEQAPGVAAYALSVVNSQEIDGIAGATAARGLGITQVVPYPFTKMSPLKIVQDYQTAMAKFSPGTPLTYTGFELYIGGRVLVDALRRASPPYTRASVTKALETTQLDLGGHKIRFDPANRAGSRFVEMTVLGSGGKVMR